MDALFATEIARDPVRVRKSYEYWVQVHQELNSDIFASIDTPAIKLATATPDESLDDLFQERAHLTSTGDTAQMLKESGCLVSSEEIASAIVRSGTSESMFEDLLVFKRAATSPEQSRPVDQVARGIIAARELFDLARRFSNCQKIVQYTSVAFPEALALYRQEGALVVTPPGDSFEHAPLVKTNGGCRRSWVSLDFDKSCERPGFNLVYRFRQATDATMRDESISFDILLRNLLVVGGLDEIVAPRLSRNDELLQLLTKARTGKPASPYLSLINSKYREKLASTSAKPANQADKKSQQQYLDQLAAGLAMVDLEFPETAPAGDDLLKLVQFRLSNLMGAHRFEKKNRSGGIDIHLLGDRTASDTFGCLLLQAKWYASRMRPHTLVAWKDRSQAFVKLPRFSPFLTYLRFHSHDGLFMGILLRTMVKLEELDNHWKKHRDTLGERFHDAFIRSKWSKSESLVLKKSLDKHWVPRVHQDDVWHHIGLVAAIKAHDTETSWLTDAKPPTPDLSRTADVARRALETISGQELVESLNVALEFTPISVLVDKGMVPTKVRDPRAVLFNSHSFERVRLVYAQAARMAGI